GPWGDAVPDPLPEHLLGRRRSGAANECVLRVRVFGDADEDHGGARSGVRVPGAWASARIVAGAASKRGRIDEDRLDAERLDLGAGQKAGAAVVLTIADRDRRREDRQIVDGARPDAEQARRHEDGPDHGRDDDRDRWPDRCSSEIQPHGRSTTRRPPMRRVRDRLLPGRAPIVGAMRNLDDNTITDAVLAAMADSPNERLKVMITSLVRHLHDFAREVYLTEDEWFEGIRFLTEAGRITDDKRQEFILLSDVLGLSMLVTMQNN